MQPQSAQDYKNLLTEVIKKQIVILGPDITLSKARNVKGLTVQDDGTVTEVAGSPQEVTQALIDQFVQLSGLIVKKTMEPLLRSTQETPQEVSRGTSTQTPQAATTTQAQPLADTSQPIPAVPSVEPQLISQPPLSVPPEAASPVQPTIQTRTSQAQNQVPNVNLASPTPTPETPSQVPNQSSSTIPSQPATPGEATPQPAKNPLAA